MEIAVDYYANDRGLESLADWYVRLWVARSVDEPVGFLSADSEGEIDFVVVDGPAQGYGVARELVRLSRAHFAEQGKTLSHGYPVSPQGRIVMTRYDIPARPLRPHKLQQTQVEWSDEEATVRGAQLLAAIRGEGAKAVAVPPTALGIYSWDAEPVPIPVDAEQPPATA